MPTSSWYNSTRTTFAARLPQIGDSRLNTLARVLPGKALTLLARAIRPSSQSSQVGRGALA